MAAQKRLHLSGYRSPETSSLDSSISNTPNHLRTPPVDDSSTLPTQPLPPVPLLTNARLPSGSADSLDPKTAAFRRPLYSASTSVSISHQTSAHIILPSSATHASAPCSLTQLTKCVVDLSVPSNDGAPFAGLTVKGVRQCLLVCGNIEGAAHITDVEESAIVVTSRQFRMHECKNVDVYLSCSSRPIIEDCQGIHFARIPDTYVSAGHRDYISEYLRHYHSVNMSRNDPRLMTFGIRLMISIG
jgi:tubulin-specific chaperone C